LFILARGSSYAIAILRHWRTLFLDEVQTAKHLPATAIALERQKASRLTSAASKIAQY
jgi:hypothetical protein